MPLRRRNRNRRVVITGLGPVSCLGLGKDNLWEGLVAGRSGIGPITHFDPTNFPCKIGGEVPDFQPADFISRNNLKNTARFTQFAVAAARLAFEDSGLNDHSGDRRRLGACMGSSALGWGDIAPGQYERFLSKGYRGINITSCAEFTTHMATTHVCGELNLKGINATISTGCSTALDAVNWAGSQIRQGTADVIVAGGTDAPLFPYMFASFCAIRVLSRRNDEPEKASRPWDALRDGIVLSEGGSAIVLEEMNHARDRGAHIYAEVLGYGSAAEAGGTLEVDRSGAAIAGAIQTALDSASLSRDSIDYINGHGCSLPEYDIGETNAIKTAFGERAYLVPVSSGKSMLGQTLAAASGYQIISSCFTIELGIIPPTINYEHADPQCDLDYVPNRYRYNRVRRIMINSHSVGGTHSVMIIGAFEEPV